MRKGTMAAVITATLVAIGTALGIASSSSDAEIPADFLTITYTRPIEHGQIDVFGECPLGRQVAIDGKGNGEIIWFVQTAGIHGCSRAMSFDSDLDDQEKWDEPIIAREKFALNREGLSAYLNQLDAIRWSAQWQTEGATPSSQTSGCSGTYTDAMAERYLFVEKPGPLYALLAIYGEEAHHFNDVGCVVSEKANAKLLDAATTSFAPLMPSRYRLAPAVAARL